MINIFKGTYSNIPKIQLITKLAAISASTQADFVILAGFHKLEYWIQAVILLIRGKKFGVFCDSTIYDNHQTLSKTVLKRIFFMMCKYAFCYGERSKSYLRYLWVDKANIFVRCQASTVPDGYSATSVLQKREELSPPSNAPLFLYIGRLSPEKRIDSLILAFKKVSESMPDARLRIVGDGPIRGELSNLAIECDLTGRVEFTGARAGSDLYDNYLSATCLVLPSASEPWGLVVNEALLLWLPGCCFRSLRVRARTRCKFRDGYRVPLRRCRCARRRLD